MIGGVTALEAEQPLHLAGVTAGRHVHLATQPAGAGAGLLLQQVRPEGLAPTQLPRSRDLEPLGGAPVRFHLRHAQLSCRCPSAPRSAAPSGRPPGPAAPLTATPGPSSAPSDRSARAADDRCARLSGARTMIMLR